MVYRNLFAKSHQRNQEKQQKSAHHYLSPNDFFLFPYVKQKMRGQRFSSPEDAVDDFQNHVSEISTSEWKNCFTNWFERMEKCINLKGEYFEKQ